MDSFVKDIVRGSMKRESDITNSNMKQVLKYIMTSNTSNIEILGINDTGDFKFVIKTKDMNLTPDIISKYRNSILTDFFANFVGEFAIRENINIFANILVNISDKDYNLMVNEYSHQKFGMEICKDYFVFMFHASLVQSIITEDFKKEIKNKTKHRCL